ncbi:delta-1-pyrroline-5-carboxylate dehydrogenase 1 [Xylona heveae TC161]|uniref:Multifunctional fusion protein n=1 Tax=Xylona heveae (strain CBS 132557 / TC161) TaxID=1328760 RepID=A0A165FSZ5_XYLHT|nr:delta-1-pyrroline-5-carboxylate dehydrogenase 1 [Xylona heveae TC161]KZF21337.1 delta-1-pyrroline-5-carboxylate dehydrogenase 1 [Xylona heveae TC161]
MAPAPLRQTLTQASRRTGTLAFAQKNALRSTCQAASFSMYKKPFFDNEDAKSYAKGSPERTELTEAIKSLKATLPVNVPLNIAGKEVTPDAIQTQPNPSDHQTTIANYGAASAAQVNDAIEAALKAKPTWENLPLEQRASVFHRAAELVSTKYRADLVAASMLGQGKNIWQAEIDIVAETCDLLRFAVQCALDLAATQPAKHPPGMWNRVEYRPLEGFVYAVSPFNFTALGANLIGIPLLMGNAVIWKPSNSAVHSCWLVHKILLEAGLPEGVVQFVPGDAELITKTVLEHPEFAALHFTGSTDVFKKLYGKIGQATAENKFKSYPRIIGETGGKNFHLIHKSAEIDNAVYNTVRGGFEYQGQKCSAPSRVYVAESIWPTFKEKLLAETAKVKTGAPEEYDNFVNAVIHEASFDKLNAVIEKAKSDDKVTLLAGGKASKEKGYFVEPTIYQTSDPQHELMTRELFGPILTIYVYPDAEWAETIKLVDNTTSYGLAGSVFAQDQVAIHQAEVGLKHSAGNFYINTKSTGSVVAQQPFGGNRGSGTNDKVGSVNLLTRFASVRSVKDDYAPLKGFKYPSNEV